MEHILLLIGVGIAVRVIIGLIRRAFSSPSAPPALPIVDAATANEIANELDAICRSPEHGTLLLRNVRGCQLHIDGVALDVDALESGGYRDAGGGAVMLEHVCPGRHSIRAKTLTFTVFLQPNEDTSRTLTATGWHEPDGYSKADDAVTVDYADVIATKLKPTSHATARVERMLDLFAADAPIQAMVNQLEAAPLTKEAFSSLVGRVSLAIEHRARREETFAPAADLAKIALTVMPDEPRLLVHLAELEAALGRENEARAHIARARPRGLDDAWAARANAVIRECDA